MRFLGCDTRARTQGSTNAGSWVCVRHLHGGCCSAGKGAWVHAPRERYASLTSACEACGESPSWPNGQSLMPAACPPPPRGAVLARNKRAQKQHKRHGWSNSLYAGYFLHVEEIDCTSAADAAKINPGQISPAEPAAAASFGSRHRVWHRRPEQRWTWGDR